MSEWEAKFSISASAANSAEISIRRLIDDRPENLPVQGKMQRKQIEGDSSSMVSV